MRYPLGRLCVVGVGLIGGSFALALKKKKLVKEVIGVGRNLENLKTAKSLGIIEEFTLEIKEGVRGAELVVLATPMLAMPRLIRKAKKDFMNGAILTDVGSTKLKFIKEVEPLLPDGVYLVPAHPIAGREKSGARYADPELFRDHFTIITPCENSNEEAVSLVKNLWEKIGAKVEVMSPDVHDRILARVSHLPHIVAYALVECMIRLEKKERMLRFSAGGFRDFIRISGSSPEMWRDICLENKKEILDAMDNFQDAFENLRRLIERAEGQKLLRLFSSARKIKELVRGEQ